MHAPGATREAVREVAVPLRGDSGSRNEFPGGSGGKEDERRENCPATTWRFAGQEQGSMRRGHSDRAKGIRMPTGHFRGTAGAGTGPAPETAFEARR